MPPYRRHRSQPPQGAYRNAGGGNNLTLELWSLLWSAAASPEYRARLCAVEWAYDLFDFSDVSARRLCVSLCDDKVMAVRSAASRGLQPPPPPTAGTESGSATDEAASSRHPRFEAFVLGAMRDEAAPPALVRGGEPAPASLKELPPAALARALDFALECHKAHARSNGDGGGRASGGERGDSSMEVEGDTEEAVAVFLAVIETTLASAPSVTDGQHGHAQMVLLHRSAAVALQRLAAGDVTDAPGQAFLPQADGHDGGGGRTEESTAGSGPVVGVAAKLSSRGAWLQQWLGHEGSTEIREAFAETAGAAAEFMDPNSELVPFLRALGHKLKVRRRGLAKCFFGARPRFDTCLRFDKFVKFTGRIEWRDKIRERRFTVSSVSTKMYAACRALFSLQRISQLLLFVSSYVLSNYSSALIMLLLLLLLDDSASLHPTCPHFLFDSPTRVPALRTAVPALSRRRLQPCTMPGAAGFTNRAVSSAHGAACALGAVLARLAAGTPDDNSRASSPGYLAWAALSEDALPASLSAIAAAIGHPVSLLHVAACGAVGRVGAAGPLPVRSGQSAAAAAARAPSTTTVQAVFERLWAACTLGETTDASRRTEAAAEALGRCCRGEGAGAGGGGGGGDYSARVRKTLRVLFDMAKNQVSRGQEGPQRGERGRAGGAGKGAMAADTFPQRGRLESTPQGRFVYEPCLDICCAGARCSAASKHVLQVVWICILAQTVVILARTVKIAPRISCTIAESIVWLSHVGIEDKQKTMFVLASCSLRCPLSRVSPKDPDNHAPMILPRSPFTPQNPSRCLKSIQKEEELQFAVGAAVADLTCSGPLRVPSGKVLEDMRAAALAARREMKEEPTENGGVLVDALDYVLYQVSVCSRAES